MKNPVIVDGLKLKIVSMKFEGDSLHTEVVIANSTVASSPCVFTIPLNTEKSKAILSFKELLEQQVLEYLDARPRKETHL